MGIWPFSNRRSSVNGVLVGDGEFAFPIVGESHYQRALDVICGGKTERGARDKHAALLSPQPTNPYDKNAVCVKIKGSIVGHLSRDVAPDFLQALFTAGYQHAAAEAIIVGGWRSALSEGHFGVRLDACMPFVFISPDEYFQNKERFHAQTR